MGETPKIQNKFFIYYANGEMETTNQLNITLLHMVEVGVVKTIFDCNDNEAWIRISDGTSKKLKITHINF